MKVCYASISPIQEDAEILNKIIANQIQQHIKNIQQNKVGILPGMQG